jgi:hypothetical protein
MSFTLPAVVAIAIAGAYLAGRYVGGYDQRKLCAAQQGLLGRSGAVEELQFTSQVLHAVKEGNTAQAERALRMRALMQVSAARACLPDPLCSFFAAPSAESRAKVESYLSEAGRYAP